ncbi:MAG: EI24 domain-containing protein [Leeuwenhoekiella sp.]
MIKNVFTAIKAYSGSLKLIKELGLWKYFAIPMIISFLTAAILIFATWGLSDNIGAFIARLWFWEWGAETFQTISTVLGGLIILALGLILYKHIVMAFCAPFMSAVSEKIESHFKGSGHLHRDTSNTAQLLRGIRINVRNLLMELLLTIPILLLGFIPVIGLFTTVLLFLVQAYYAGFGNMDYTLERHLKYDQSVDFVKKNRGFAIGNGIIFMLFLLIPVVGIILVLPMSVTAATVVTIKLLEKQGPARYSLEEGSL